MFVALAIGADLDPSWSLRAWILQLPGDDALDAFGIAAAAGLAMLAAGFAIGTISIVFLRLLGLMCSSLRYEAVLSNSQRDRVWEVHLKGTGEVDCSHIPYIAAAFDHGALLEGHRGWLDRRWNAFNLSLHSGVALLVAILVVYFNGFRPGCRWYSSVLSFSIIFFINAAFARCDTRKMNDLLSRIKPKQESDDAAKQGGSP